MDVPNNGTINQNRLDRLRTKLTTSLQAPASNEEERALLSEILQRVTQEHGCTAEQLALAALEFSLAGKPLLIQGEDNFDQVRQNGPSRDIGRDPRRSRDGGREFSRDGGRAGGLDAGRGAPRGDRPMGPPEDHMERFRVEVGWRDRIKPGNIVGAIANEAGLNGRSIGRIQIFDTHSTVDLPKGMPEDVFQGLRQLRVMNKPLQISRFDG
jgi:ATP-dependent RNA helicase DeaD